MLLARACNVALDSGVPDWIQLLPAGPAITGHDGRSWRLPDPQPLITAFQARQRPLVIDWEHASEHRAPVGLDAPAAGWIDQLEARHGAVWGHVEWTERAKQQIAAKEYRFISPVFTYQKADSAIAQLVSAGLTNQPNLNLTALNREESPVSLLNALRVALDLTGTPDEEQVVAAAKALKTELATARNAAATPALDKFVPRADYDAALAQASNAEARLSEIEKARQAQEITALIESALHARKITPATKDFYIAVCQQADGIAQFKAFLDKAPALVGDPSGLGDKPLPQPGDPAVEFAANAALRAEFGDVEIYKAYRAAVASGRAAILGAKA